MEYTIHLSADDAEQLASLARQRKLPEGRVLQELVDESLADLRDSRVADEIYARHLAGDEPSLTLEDLERRLGLAD